MLDGMQMIDILTINTEEEMRELIGFAAESKEYAEEGEGTCCHIACIDGIKWFQSIEDPKWPWDLLSNGRHWVNANFSCIICDKPLQFASPPSPTAFKRVLKVKLI